VGVELVSVSCDEVELLEDGELFSVTGLAPDTTHTIEGLEVHTLPKPGEYLCSVATTNDVHFGEVECGRLGETATGPIFTVPAGVEPYPSMMSRLAVEEIAARNPAAVVVKGDLTADGRPEEYAAFLDCYGTAFGDRLTHVRGNHDCYRNQDYASEPVQVVQVPGALVVLLDTCRPGHTNGTLRADQLEQLDELGQRADRPVIVLGHHPIWDARYEPRSDDVFSLLPDPTDALLHVFERRRRLVTYAAGHTHRNHVVEVAGVPFVDVGALKDFPGAWCEYQIFDAGILQVVHRVAHPEGLRWAERTRAMYLGAYGEYAYGSLEERCRLLPSCGG